MKNCTDLAEGEAEAGAEATAFGQPDLWQMPDAGATSFGQPVVWQMPDAEATAFWQPSLWHKPDAEATVAMTVMWQSSLGKRET